MSAPDNPSNLNTIRELHNLKELVDETVASLKSQQEVLKQREMHLPPLVIPTLEGLKSEFQKLEAELLTDQTELGQLRALADMSAKITTSLDIDVVLEEAMDIVIALTRAERGYIVLRDLETDELVFRAGQDTTPASMGGDSGSSKPQISHSVLNDVLASGEALLADNAYKDERLQGNVSIANLTLRSVLCVPLIYKDEVIGAVYVDNRLQSGVFEEREKNLLTAFANTAAVAITNARLFARLQQILTEITQVKQLLDNVFDSIGSGVIATDSSNKVNTFNRAAAEILEREAESAVGQPLIRVLPRISADLNDYLQAIHEQSKTQTFDGELQAGRGRIAISMKLSPLKDAEQQTQGVAVVLDDLTQQVERENKLHVARYYLPTGMVEKLDAIDELGLGGERREVTCMFADVRPLSTLPRGIRPRDLMRELNVFLAVATERISAAQGVIDKYMGTEIMVLYNTQLNPQDNHAQIAIDTALAMRDAFMELYRELGIDPNPHFYRIGIHTGVATMGNVGSLNRRDFTAIGDTINLSKRIEENTDAGQIILSQDVYDHLVDHNVYGGEADLPYSFAEREPMKVKGREQRTRVYEVFKA